MKILHLCDKSGGGGDAVAMVRLHRALVRAGHESRILVARSAGGSFPEEGLHVLPAKSPWQKLGYLGGLLSGLNYAAIPGSARVLRGMEVWEWADVVHLHTLHGGYLNYRALRELGARKPLVWTLHDMWALTGHCAYSLDCVRWETGCGRCPHLDTYPAMAFDFSALEWRWKQASFGAAIRHLICPSRWLEDCVGRSLLRNVPRSCVPYGLDVELYRPGDKESCRRELGLPGGKTVFLYAAQSFRNPFKDAGAMPEVLRALKEPIRKNGALALMGGRGQGLFRHCGIPVVELGYIEDEARKAKVYRAADVLVFPTRADNLPLVIQEAMACGCPAVAADVGGVPDMVRTGHTGTLVPAGSPVAMARGLEEMIERPESYSRLAQNCRAHAVEHYDLSRHAEAVASIYRQAAGAA